VPKNWSSSFCTTKGCTGSGLAQYGGGCLAHLGEHQLEEYLITVGRDRSIDARGVEISSELFFRIKDLVRDNRWVDVQFDEATFLGDATFTSATFERQASFTKAVFNGEPNFDSVTFECDAVFTGAHFLSERDWASFWEAQFHRDALFNGMDSHGQFHFGLTTIVGDATFEGGRFRAKATFDPTVFLGQADFCEVTFDGIANFNDSQFAMPPDFSRAIFRNEIQLDGVRVSGLIDADAGEATTQLGRKIVLDDVEFDRGVEIVLGKDADLRVENSLFAGPSTIRSESGIEGHQPTISSLRGSDVGNLLLSGVDLTYCLFGGAHNLDRLRMENRPSLLHPPRGIEVGSRWPFLYRWSQREVIYEEYIWRAAKDSFRWFPVQEHGSDDPPALDPADIAAIYRSLRKGREDNKDAPGASDLYYGEMEMRRRSQPFLSTEGFVLFWYWILSGYALRASRAFGALVIFTIVSTLFLYYFGFSHSVSLGHAIPVGVQNTTNILGLQRDPLINSGWGLVIYAAQHLIGTLLIGLTVVSFRGRLQR
jgi:uncharacterized protein YjbI with pentapeptide repeats